MDRPKLHKPLFDRRRGGQGLRSVGGIVMTGLREGVVPFVTIHLVFQKPCQPLWIPFHRGPSKISEMSEEPTARDQKQQGE